MKTGIKLLDNVIKKHGISQELIENEFQSSLRLFSNDSRLKSLRLPPCIAQIIMTMKLSETVVLHRFYLSYQAKAPRITFLLVSEDGKVLKHVCFSKHAKYKAASTAIASMFERQLAVAA